MKKIPKMKTIRYQIWYVNLNKKWYDIRNYSRLECIFWGGRRSVVLVGVVVTVVSKWWLWDVNEKGSQAWCYSLLSRYIIQVCKMLHLFVSTFRHGALISSYIYKGEKTCCAIIIVFPHYCDTSDSIRLGQIHWSHCRKCF